MNPSDKISCLNFPCKDIEKSAYQIPNLDIDPDKIKLVMISEVPPLNPKDYFYFQGTPSYMETTKEIFRDAGYTINSIQDVLNLGVYITTAVKMCKDWNIDFNRYHKRMLIYFRRRIETFPKC